MAKARYVTHIQQLKVKVLGPSHWEGYERNRPGPQWELIEYVDVKNDDGTPHRAWTPNYSLKYGYIRDHSKVQIVGDVKEATL